MAGPGPEYDEGGSAAGTVQPADRLAILECAYALEIGDPNALDVYLRSEDPFVALEEILGDEPEYTGLPSVVPIELDERGHLSELGAWSKHRP